MHTSLSFDVVTRTVPPIAPDGFVRLRFAELERSSLLHQFSVEDTDLLRSLRAGGVQASDAGFSEWKGEHLSALSIGWGWFVHRKSGRLHSIPGDVFSNLMLIDVSGYDMGRTATSDLLSTWLLEFSWQQTVADALGKPASVPSYQPC